MKLKLSIYGKKKVGDSIKEKIHIYQIKKLPPSKSNQLTIQHTHALKKKHKTKEAEATCAIPK